MFSFILSFVIPLLGVKVDAQKPVKVLATHEFSMEKRYDNTYVNDVFKDNILLAIDYLKNDKIDPSKIDWNKVEQPFSYNLTLKPGEVFAFHDDVLSQFKNKVKKTTNAHFMWSEGFKSDGWLVGDGVCHLASLMYWTAKDAGLEALAPTRHDFAKINEVPREYGVAIFSLPGSGGNAQQNLYITNNKDKEIVFNFDYNGKELKITAQEN